VPRWSKAWVFGRSLAGIAGSNSARGLWVLCVSASGWSLVQRSPNVCGVSECDREASKIRRPRPTRGCRATGEGRGELTVILLQFQHKKVPWHNVLTYLIITYIQQQTVLSSWIFIPWMQHNLLFPTSHTCSLKTAHQIALEFLPKQEVSKCVVVIRLCNCYKKSHQLVR